MDPILAREKKVHGSQTKLEELCMYLSGGEGGMGSYVHKGGKRLCRFLSGPVWATWILY